MSVETEEQERVEMGKEFQLVGVTEPHAGFQRLCELWVVEDFDIFLTMQLIKQKN
jgi:hypothetical protein